MQKTYDNEEEWVMKAMEAQGFIRDENGLFQVPESGELKMKIPASLIPKCPDDGLDVTERYQDKKYISTIFGITIFYSETIYRVKYH